MTSDVMLGRRFEGDLQLTWNVLRGVIIHLGDDSKVGLTCSPGPALRALVGRSRLRARRALSLVLSAQFRHYLAPTPTEKLSKKAPRRINVDMEDALPFGISKWLALLPMRTPLRAMSFWTFVLRMTWNL